MNNNKLLPAFEATPVYSSFTSSTEASTSKISLKLNPFSRSRSNSMHSNSGPSSPFLKDSPIPALPTSPHSVISTPTTDSTTSNLKTQILSLSVPYYHSKGRNYVYAIRVVPDTSSENDLAFMAKSIKNRKDSVGKMDRAESESMQPYTVYRSWSEFQDLSNRLSAAFPRVHTLSRRITIFVTKSTLVQRQQECDTFVRNLKYANDPIAGDFFRQRESDKPQNVAKFDSPKSFASFNADATIRVSAGKEEKVRPPLPEKRSVPNLRSNYEELEGTPEAKSTFSQATIRPIPRTYTPLNIPAINPRISTISSATITPIVPTVDPTPPPVEIPLVKKRSHILRSFRSLQELRTNSAPAIPDIIPPVPSISNSMLRSQTQPISSFNHPAVLRRNRSSSKSSTSSFEDFGSVLHSTASLEARRPSLSRLHSVAEQHNHYSGPVYNEESKTAPRASSIARASTGHSPSPSSSSFSSFERKSFDRNRSGSFDRSLRSSTDFSEFSPNTPPTPYLGDETESFSGKFFVNKFGMLQSKNEVPLPPFFPVPPSMSRTRSRTSSSVSSRTPLEPINASPKLDCFPSLAKIDFEPQVLSIESEPQILFKIIHTDCIALKAARNITLESLKTLISVKFAEFSFPLEGSWSLAYQPSLKSSGDSTRTLSTEPIASQEAFETILEMNSSETKVSMRIILA